MGDEYKFGTRGGFDLFAHRLLRWLTGFAPYLSTRRHSIGPVLLLGTVSFNSS